MKASLRKNREAVRWLTLVLGAGSAWLGATGCSTTSTLVPQAPPEQVAVPAYAYLPHPGSYASGEVRLLFTDKSAPARETLSKCEDDLRMLYQKSQSGDERAQGVRELVSRDPAAYHWCFYSRILDLEEGLGKDEFVDEKQKRIVSTYEFLVPVAQAFMREFQDSRYMRWTIRDYRRLADLYFFRKLEMSPEMSSKLVDVAVPVEERTPATLGDASKTSVIEKYKIGNAVKSEPAAELDPEMAETLQMAQDLARERKEAQGKRAPASASAPATAPAQSEIEDVLPPPADVNGSTK